MPLSKGVTHALDNDSRLVPLPVMAPLQRTLEDGLRHAVASLTGGGLTELASKRAKLLASCGGFGVRHKMIPESPYAQFEKSMAPTRGHNSTREREKKKKRQWERKRGKKREILGLPPFGLPPFGPLLFLGLGPHRSGRTWTAPTGTPRRRLHTNTDHIDYPKIVFFVFGPSLGRSRPGPESAGPEPEKKKGQSRPGLKSVASDHFLRNGERILVVLSWFDVIPFTLLNGTLVLREDDIGNDVCFGPAFAAGLSAHAPLASSRFPLAFPSLIIPQ